MKKCWILLLALVLSGCAAEETMETVADEWVAPVMAQPREASADLPESAAAPVLESDSCQVYMNEGYEITVETLSSGDLQETVRTMSGYDREDLTMVQTQWAHGNRYEFVWACAGEQGQRLGRGVILDDGQYHYCMSALWDTQMEETVSWDSVFQSFSVDAY